MERMEEAEITSRQVPAIVLCGLLNALDGYDILSISFASPGIARSWGINHAALGVVLSMELFGMAAGSVLLGQIADRVGRRATVLGCLAVMALGMAVTSVVQGIGELAAIRFATGLGIGGMLATTNALVAECARPRWKSTAVALMAAGYPFGSVVGGACASALLVHGDWRGVFLLGAGVAGALWLLAALLLPETLPEKQAGPGKQGGRAPRLSLPHLFAPDLRAVTLLLTAAYFCHIFTFYFMLKWIPKIVADMGFAPAAAGKVLVVSSLGGLAGGLVFGLLSAKAPTRTLLIAALFASALAVAAFGQAPHALPALARAAFIGGFATNGAVVMFYALIAVSFPTSARAGGTGFVIGMGRGGAAMGPIVAGLLFQAGFGLATVAAFMASGALLAALVLLALFSGQIVAAKRSACSP